MTNVNRMSDVWLVTCPLGLASRAGHLDGRHARGRRADARLARLESVQSPGRPDGLLHLAPAEALSAEIPIGVQERRGQLHLVIHGGDVLGWYADLNHLEILGRLQHPVPDLRRLNDAIARLQARTAALDPRTPA